MTPQQIQVWATAHPEQAIALARKTRVLRATLARTDVNVFMEYVMRDERSVAGRQHIRQSTIHRRFQAFANDYDRLLLWSHMEAGKTQQISIGRTLWELGKNPNLRFGIFSSTENQSRKIARTIAEYIDTSDELHEVFPHLRRGALWNDSALVVQRTSIAKDPSVQCSPLTGKVLGSRLDRAILDDVLTFESAFSAAKRTHLWDWYQKNIPGRITEGGKVLVVGNAFAPDDFMHTLAKNTSWHSEKFPLVGPDGKSTWPEVWSEARIAARRAELTPEEFNRQMLCVARDDASSRFQRLWVDACMERGEGRKPAVALQNIPPGYSVHTGVDLGSRQHKKSDQTVLLTFVQHPDGSMEIIEVQSGRWAGPEIVQRVIDVHHRFRSIVYVENVHAQQFIVDFTKHTSSVPVVPFATDSRKNHPEFGIETIAVQMANRKWIIPNENGKCHPEIEALVQEILYYDPNAHTGDRLMAMWIAMEGARRQKPKLQYGRFDRKL